MKPVKWPWTDYQIRDFYFGAKDPVEQVFILAELCAKPPELMLEKLLTLELIPSDEVKEAVLARIRGEPVIPLSPEDYMDSAKIQALQRAERLARKREQYRKNHDKELERSRQYRERLRADPERYARYIEDSRKREARRQQKRREKKALLNAEAERKKAV